MTARFNVQARLSETLRLALVYRLAHELNADLSSQDVLRRVLHATAEALGTPYASIVAFRNQTLTAAYALGGGHDDDPRPVLERVLAEGLAGFVQHNYRTVIVNDISSSPLWVPLPGESLSPQSGSALCVPLIHLGDVVGVMTVTHPVCHYFTADAVNLTNTISELGAAALANALLIEDLRRANLRYSHLFDDVIVPVLLTDLDGTIIATNRSACEFLGYVRAELEGQSISVVHRNGVGTVAGDRRDHLVCGREVRARAVACNRAGEELPVQIYAKRVYNRRGEDYIQWIEHDLSSELALERLREDLAAMIYHDMRGPLGNISASLSALKPLLADHHDARVTDLVEVAARSEEQVRRMVESLLDVQRLEQGSCLLNRTSTALNILVLDAVNQMRPHADEKDVQLKLALAADLPLSYVDTNMIARVLLNLIDNAIKYSSDGGDVTVSTASSGDEIIVRIADTGPGIPHEARDHIFDKYARVRQHEMPYGVGLGLAFCKLAIHAHQGRIWVRSSIDNRESGSVFTFTLPIEAPATQELPLLGAVTS